MSHTLEFSHGSVTLNEEQYKVVAFTPTHQELYVTAFNIFQKYQIFGSGLKTFRTECKNKNYSQSELGCNIHPHTFYIQIIFFRLSNSQGSSQKQAKTG